MAQRKDEDQDQVKLKGCKLDFLSPHHASGKTSTFQFSQQVRDQL